MPLVLGTRGWRFRERVETEETASLVAVAVGCRDGKLILRTIAIAKKSASEVTYVKSYLPLPLFQIHKRK